MCATESGAARCIPTAGRGSLMGWLRTTLAQRHVDHYRRTRREEPIEEIDLPAPDPPPQTPTSELSLLERAIAKAVSSREAEERYLLAAYYLDGQTLLRIARVLGVHEATVSRKLRRAEKEIRKQISESRAQRHEPARRRGDDGRRFARRGREFEKTVAKFSGRGVPGTGSNMSATSQHGFHPDAESLNAFAEQALRDRERAEVLAHLAVCGRCRQVVALARAAADAGVANASKTARKTIEPDAWWKHWRLVWVPTAIVATFAVASISVYIERADRHASTVKIAEQTPPEEPAPASTSAPTEQAQVEPPASAASAPAPAHTAKHAHPAALKPLPAPASPAVTPKKPPEPGPVNQVEVAREAPPLSHAEERQVPPEFAVGGHASSFLAARRRCAGGEAEASGGTTTGSGGDVAHALVYRQAGARRGARLQPAHAAASFGKRYSHGVGSDGNGDKWTCAANSQLAVGSLWKASTPAKQIHLPSDLPVISSTSTGPLILAIDKARTLFLSEDQGDTWERVKKQWKGRAAEVTQQSATNAGAQSTPAAETETAPNSPTDSSNPPTVIFELLNDHSQAWVSTDGRTWMSK